MKLLESVIISIVMFVLVNISLADVPVRDAKLADQELEHNTFQAPEFLGRITLILDDLAQAADYASQVSDLTKLIDLEQELADKCDKYCNQEEFKQIHNYLDELNKSFANKFKSAGWSLKTGSNSIKDVQKFIQSIPTAHGLKIKAAEVTAALQQASLKAQHDIQMILLQIQNLSLQQEQKHIMETKIERANTNAIYNGLGKSSL